MEVCVIFQICQSGLFCTCMSCFISYNCFLHCLIHVHHIVGKVIMWAGRSCNCFRTTHGWPTHGGSLRSIGRRSPWPRRRNKTATQSDTKPIETIVVDSHYLSLTWLWFDLLILLWHVGVLRLLNLLSTTCWSLIQHIQLNPIQIVQFTCDMCVTCALQLRKKWSKFWIVRKLAGFPIETNPKN